MTISFTNHHSTKQLCVCQNQHCSFTCLSNMNPFRFSPFTLKTGNGAVDTLKIDKGIQCT